VCTSTPISVSDSTCRRYQWHGGLGGDTPLGWKAMLTQQWLTYINNSLALNMAAGVTSDDNTPTSTVGDTLHRRRWTCGGICLGLRDARSTTCYVMNVARSARCMMQW
jgi:hypothetical protein